MPTDDCSILVHNNNIVGRIDSWNLQERPQALLMGHDLPGTTITIMTIRDNDVTSQQLIACVFCVYCTGN